MGKMSGTFRNQYRFYIFSDVSSLGERPHIRTLHVVIVNNDNDVGEKREERGQIPSVRPSVWVLVPDFIFSDVSNLGERPHIRTLHVVVVKNNKERKKET